MPSCKYQTANGSPPLLIATFQTLLSRFTCETLKQKSSFPVVFLNYLFTFGCIGSSLLHVGFLQLRRAGATLGCGVRAPHCGGFSCCGARALERRLSSCGTWAQLFCGMWDLPGPGLEPMSPALAGGFLTTAPPGKPFPFVLNLRN